ncbi:epiplakin-like [Vidua chalybeata]|uniref:epiplakin-like n=1 Tax=Vidua chalybeata TaxID=81927 RepID=UPI0023A88B3C|nr:epiplakin-like [Vidua chalybeata]
MGTPPPPINAAGPQHGWGFKFGEGDTQNWGIPSKARGTLAFPKTPSQLWGRHCENHTGICVLPEALFVSPSSDAPSAPEQQHSSPETVRKMSGCSQDNEPSGPGSNAAAGEHKEMAGGGSSFIAGVFLQAKKKRLSIYEAMMRGLLTPGTALVLLEAQAASGLLTEPARNERLSVKEALAQGLIGRDFYEKLLSAEGAVTGYTEPCTGRRMSLFQAMKKELIVRDHGIRLLQAQIATGGIIDPARGHRVPVEVAYERGYFDQETSQILSDPENQARTCFDPNTHENLTYLQLLRRCVPDPETGLLMLQLMDKGSVLYQLTEDARRALQAARTTLPVGLFQGQSVTVWELLFSRYVPEHQREELLRKYKAGTVTIQEMMSVLTATITAAERENGALGSSTAKPSNKARASPPAQDPQAQEQQLRKSLKSATVRVTAGEFRGKNVSVLDLLFSKYVPQGKRQELLELYRAGILTTEQVATVVTTIVNRTEAANAALVANARGPHRAVAAAGEDGEDRSAHLDDALRSTTISVPAGELQGQQVSLWDLIFSDYIPEEKRQELLELYHERLLTLEQMTTVVSTLIRKKESTGRKLHITVKSSSKEPVTAAGEEGDDTPKEEPWKTTLKTTMVNVEAGEFRGHKVSLWELLHSHYIPEESRKELLEVYEAGELTLEQVKTVVTTIVTRAAAAERAEPAAPVSGPRAEPVTTEAEPTPLQGDRAWEETLKATTAEVSVGEFQDRQISLWDLLFSDYIPEEKRQELLELYHERLLTLEQMTTVVSTLIRKKESTGRKFHITVKSSSKEPVTAAGEEGDDTPKEEPWKTTLKTTMVNVEAGEFRGHKVSLWELLHSHYIPEESRKELLEVYEAGELTLEQVKTVVTTIVTRAAAAERAEPAAPVSGPRAEPVATEAEPTPLQGDRAWEETLKATTAEVSVGEFQGRQISLWDLLFSDYIPEEKRQELLELYRGGTLPTQELLSTTSSLASDSLEKHFRALPAHTMDLLRSEGSYITFDPSQERRVSVWELLSSKQVSEYKREACLDTYPSGGLTVNRITITTTITTGPRLEKSHPRRH